MSIAILTGKWPKHTRTIEYLNLRFTRMQQTDQHYRFPLQPHKVLDLYPFSKRPRTLFCAQQGLANLHIFRHIVEHFVHLELKSDHCSFDCSWPNIAPDLFGFHKTIENAVSLLPPPAPAPAPPPPPPLPRPPPRGSLVVHELLVLRLVTLVAVQAAAHRHVHLRQPRILQHLQRARLTRSALVNTAVISRFPFRNLQP